MGFHRRHISNEQVVRLFKEGGSGRVLDWYTRGVDALVTELGLSSNISRVINDHEWQLLGTHSIQEQITNMVLDYLGIEETKK